MFNLMLFVVCFVKLLFVVICVVFVLVVVFVDEFIILDQVKVIGLCFWVVDVEICQLIFVVSCDDIV